MRYEVAKSCMGVMALGSGDTLAALGISPDDFAKVTGALPWVASDRNRVRAGLDALLFGSMDVVGVPRFEAPAEYIAACIAVFVAPVNLMVICRWMETGRTAEELGGDDVATAEPVNASRLFALVCQLSQSEAAGAAREQFHKRVGLAIDFAASKKHRAAKS